MKEIGKEEMLNIDGGYTHGCSANELLRDYYGNVQYVCVCGKGYLTTSKLADHFHQLKHKSAKMYEQKVKGKSSKGKYLGDVKVTENTKYRVIIRFPDNFEMQKLYS